MPRIGSARRSRALEHGGCPSNEFDLKGPIRLARRLDHVVVAAHIPHVASESRQAYLPCDKSLAKSSRVSPHFLIAAEHAERPSFSGRRTTISPTSPSLSGCHHHSQAAGCKTEKACHGTGLWLHADKVTFAASSRRRSPTSAAARTARKAVEHLGVQRLSAVVTCAARGRSYCSMASLMKKR